jgi:hypothetical protein
MKSSGRAKLGYQAAFLTTKGPSARAITRRRRLWFRAEREARSDRRRVTAACPVGLAGLRASERRTCSRSESEGTQSVCRGPVDAVALQRWSVATRLRSAREETSRRLARTIAEASLKASCRWCVAVHGVTRLAACRYAWL